MLRRSRSFKTAGFLSLALVVILLFWISVHGGWNNLDRYDPVASGISFAIMASTLWWAGGHVIRHARHHRKGGFHDS